MTARPKCPHVWEDGSDIEFGISHCKLCGAKDERNGYVRSICETCGNPFYPLKGSGTTECSRCLE